MPRHWLILTAVGVLAGTFALPHGAPDARRLEVTRLRAHFDSVDAELRAVHAPHLTPGQRSARATLIGWLRQYRQAGEFPRNDRLPNAMPFFRDSRGILCAMAYLIERSGRPDIVDRVALTQNNAFIPELADDPELRAWLDSAGLSVAEAARIQPQYGPWPPDVSEDDEVSSGYALTSILVSGASLTSLGLNLAAPSEGTAWAGIIAGSIGIIAGTTNLDGTDGTEKVAAVNMIVGGGAFAAGLYRLLASRSGRVVVSPLVMPTSAGPRLGLGVRTDF